MVLCFRCSCRTCMRGKGAGRQSRLVCGSICSSLEWRNLLSHSLAVAVSHGLGSSCISVLVCHMTFNHTRGALNGIEPYAWGIGDHVDCNHTRES